MTIEQRDYNSDFILEIPWPKTISKEDLSTISNLRKDNSLSASIAKMIIQESEVLIDNLVSTIIGRFIKEKSEGSTFLLAIINSYLAKGALSAYLAPSRMILKAEEYIRTGESSVSESSKKSMKFESAVQNFVNESGQIFGKEIIDFDAIDAIGQIEDDIDLRHFGEMLTKEPPLKVVDLYSEKLRKKIETDTPEEVDKDGMVRNLLQSSLEQGRIRFHQLYEAGQFT